MISSIRRALPRLLPAACFAASLAAWIWLYARFLRSFFTVPNPYLAPLSLLQWLPGFTAAILALGRARRSSRAGRRPWILLALALALWPLADFLEQTLPSGPPLLWSAIPRLAHLAAFGCALTAVFFFAPVPQARFGRLRFLLDLVIHAATWGILLWFLLVEPILKPGGPGLGQRFWIALYSIMDLVLLMLVVWLLGHSRKMMMAMGMMAGGLFLLSVQDLVSGWLLLQGATQAYVYTGFLMVGGYALIGGAAAGSAAAHPDRPAVCEPGRAGGTPAARDAAGGPEPAPRGWAGLPARWRRVEVRWLPLASTIGLIVFLLAEWNRSGTIDPMLILLTVALCLLLFLREGVIAGQAELEGYAVLLQNLEDPAFICAANGRLELENPALDGLCPASLKRGTLDSILPVRPAWKDILKEAGKEGWRGEVAVRSATRGEFPCWLLLQKLPREEGERERYAGLLHDLSPQRRQEESLREAYRQAEESRKALEALSAGLEGKVRDKTADLTRALDRVEEQNRLLRSLDRLKSEFVALTSHELRTPLMGIRAGLELIGSQKKPLPRNTLANLNLVQREAERLGRFVENILDLSALEAGRMPLQIGPLGLAEVMEEARMALAAAHGGLNGRNLKRLEVVLPADLPEVRADGHVLASVLFQLLDNAFKYAPEGPVRAAARAAGGVVEILISDSGPGIPPERRERVFQMFSRLEEPDSPRVRGVGLGLYISRKMVEAMDGRLELADSGRGLSLRILLPEFREEP